MAVFKKYKETKIVGEKGTSWYVQIHKKDYDELVPNPNFIEDSTGWSGLNEVWVSNNGKGGLRLPGGSAATGSASISGLVNSTTYYVTLKLTKNTTGVRIRLKDGSLTNVFGTGIHKLQITSGTGSSFFYIDNIVSGNYSEVVIDQVSVSPTQYNDYNIDLAEEGFEITWNGEGSTRQRTFIGSECTLKTFIRNDDEESFLYDILDGGFKEYFIRIYKGVPSTLANIWWYGYIQPSFDTVRNSYYPYEANINATDSYGYYEKDPISIFTAGGLYTAETAKNSNHSPAKIFTDFVKNMDLYSTTTIDGPCPSGHPFVCTGVKWTTQADKTLNTDPANRYYFTKGAFADNKDFPFEYKEFDAIENVAKALNVVGFLAEGSYYFLQPNEYLNNTTAANKVYKYHQVASSDVFGTVTPYPTTGSNITSLLTIDQSTNALLGGSSYVYEPPLKSATLTYTSQNKPFEMSKGAELSNNVEYSSGQILANASYDLNFDITHLEDIDLDSVQTSGNAGWLGASSGMKVAHSTFSTTMTLEIKVTDGGSNTKYLAVDETIGGGDPGIYRYPRLVWTDLQRPITLHRGYGHPDISTYTFYSGTWNSSYATGGDESIDNSNGPCYISEDWIGGQGSTPGVVNFRTDFKFSSSLPKIDFNGTVYVKVNVGSTQLYQRGSHTFPMQTYAQTVVFPLTANTRTNVKTVVNDVSSIPLAATSSDVTTAKYTATQTTNTAVEVVDLGGLVIGQNTSNPTFSIRDYYNVPISAFFQVGTDDTTSTSLNQLLVDEYLDMQVTPLKILQGSIQSSDISPLKIIKYSLNNDGNYEYFMFLGGTFNAQSEIMNGEWFRLKKG